MGISPVLSYHHLKDHSRALRTFTSLDRSEFETLLPSFEVAWNAYVYDNHITKKTRKRRFGGGRKAHLASIEDKLLFILQQFPLIAWQLHALRLTQRSVNDFVIDFDQRPIESRAKRT